MVKRGNSLTKSVNGMLKHMIPFRRTSICLQLLRRLKNLKSAQRRNSLKTIKSQIAVVSQEMLTRKMGFSSETLTRTLINLQAGY
jgi:hypothetical protein